MDNLERVMDDKMKLLLNTANEIVQSVAHRPNPISHHSDENDEDKNCFAIDKLLFSKDK